MMAARLIMVLPQSCSGWFSASPYGYYYSTAIVNTLRLLLLLLVLMPLPQTVAATIAVAVVSGVAATAAAVAATKILKQE